MACVAVFHNHIGDSDSVLRNYTLDFEKKNTWFVQHTCNWYTGVIIYLYNKSKSSIFIYSNDCLFPHFPNRHSQHKDRIIASCKSELCIPTTKC